MPPLAQVLTTTLVLDSRVYEVLFEKAVFRWARSEVVLTCCETAGLEAERFVLELSWVEGMEREEWAREAMSLAVVVDV